ncbi:MAG: EAL domain-containing protein [Cyanophyceae cyanobacterium]
MSNSQSVTHLLVIEEPEYQHQITLEENTYSIGRHSSNSIVLLSRVVSRYHATLLRVKYPEEHRETFWLIDGDLQGKRSVNGVFVNGKQCLSHELQNGDVITFGGKVQATYLIADSTSSEPKPTKQPPRLKERSKDEDNIITAVASVDKLSELGQEFLFQLARFPQLLPHPVIEINLQGEITYINAEAKQQFAEVLVAKLNHPLLKGVLDHVGSSAETLFVREVKIGTDVFEQYLHYLAEEQAIRSYIFNFTQRKQIESALWESEERYRAVVRQISEGIFLVDAQSKEIIEANAAYCELLGYSPQALLKLTLYDVTTLDREIVDSELERILTKKLDLVVETVNRRQDGSLVDVEVGISTISYGGQEVLCFAVRDITERKRSQAKLQYQAFHDVLTDLPNRILFNKRLSEAIDSAKREQRLMAVMFLDLDRFKNINDTLGHAVGDRLLKAFAERVNFCLRSGDTVARWGGDEFTILLPQISDIKYVAKVSERILRSLEQPFKIDAHQLHIKSSIGMALYPQDGRDGESLLKNADAALYQTKKQGRGHYQFYTPSMTFMASAMLKLENSLHKALEQQELSLVYQPQINIKSGKIYGMEALLRWQHPELGQVLPSKFISLAEESNLIIPIGEWVLQTACAQNQAWQEAGYPTMRMAVNLSTQQFRKSNLPATVSQVLAQTGLNPELLELEITETTLVHNVDLARKALQDLRDLGVRVSMDDFGTGYSSLSYLKQFPFHTLKIDQSFVRELTENSQDRAIISAVIVLGRGFNLRVVAEGVETKEQMQLLQHLECEEMQGFWFSRPLSAQEATQLLARNQQFVLEKAEGTPHAGTRDSGTTD